MNLQQQTKFVDDFLSRMKEVMIGKGNDYANEDRLSNFKLAGSICGLTPEQNCLSLIATKVARLGVLLGGKEPFNESIFDSLLDLANYAVLLACLRQDIRAIGVNQGTDGKSGKTLSELLDEEWKKISGARSRNSPRVNEDPSDDFVPSIDTPIYDDELVKVGNEER